MVGRKRVLVVEDDPDVRQLVAGLMVDAGFDAQTAVDGDHAIRSAAALKPDLIILDVYVPKAELAIRFAQEYRRRVRAENRAPIIAMSSKTEATSNGRAKLVNRLDPRSDVVPPGRSIAAARTPCFRRKWRG